MPFGARACKATIPHECTKKMTYPDEVTGFNYFCTITIKPEYNTKTMRQQYRKTVNQALAVLKSSSKNYRMAVEITPKNGQIHYHAIMYIDPSNFDNDQIRWIFIDKVKEKHGLGFSQISLIEDLGKSYEYITCELTKTNAVLNLDNTKAKLPVFFKPSDPEIDYSPKPRKINVITYNNTRYVSLDKNTKLDPMLQIDKDYDETMKIVDYELGEAENEIQIYNFIKKYNLIKKKISSNDILKNEVQTNQEIC